MRIPFFCLSLAAAGALALASPALAQEENIDIVTRIDGQSTDNVTVKYFNAENCSNPADTMYDLTLTNGSGVVSAYLWAGTQNGNCQNVAQRSDQLDVCRQVDGNPQTVGDNATMSDLTLQALVDTGIVNCENTALTGQVYWIYSFRNEDPGGNDVGVQGYGYAPITVDVVPPAELDITSAPEQTGSVFSVGWSTPLDQPNIIRYNMYASPEDNAEDALSRSPVSTADFNATSVSVSASVLGLAPGEQAYLFVTAVDNASVTVGDGNEGPPSVGTLGIAASTAGFCSDPSIDCSGCSVGPMTLATGHTSAGLQLVGFLLTFFAARRLRR